MAKICFITAIYGKYEASCKPAVPQTVATDFICFTDNPNIIRNNWQINLTPYHLEHKSPLDNGTYINSLSNNMHTFNVCKYYKQSFQCIPILAEYDVVVWVDATVQIIYPGTSEYILRHIEDAKVIGWHHEYQHGILQSEVRASHHAGRYNNTYWNGQPQPFQDVDKQYEEYVKDGYNDAFFKNRESYTPHFGVWLTCFVAFLNKDEDVSRFLNLWYMQTLKYTTQDQIGFPYVVQKTGLIPMTLPNANIYGDRPHERTAFYIKHAHGK
jgi:hypothetical protein